MSAAAPIEEPPPAAAARRPALRVRWIKIHRFLDLEPGTELRFNDGLNVLLGKNDSGKTTLLNLLSMIVRDDFSALKTREFDVEYGLAVDDLEVSGRMRSLPPSLRDSSGLDSPKPPRSGRFWHTLTFSYLDTTTTLEVTSGQEEVPDDASRVFKRIVADPLDVQRAALYSQHVFHPRIRVRQADGTGLVDLRQHRREAALAGSLSSYPQRAYRLDESLEVFEEGIVGGSANRPCITVTRQRVRGGPQRNLGLVVHGLYEWDVYIGLHDRFEHADSEQDFRLTDAYPYLPRLAQQLGAERVELTLGRPSVQIDGDNEILTFIAPTFYVHRRDGGVTHHEALSYGEKRLLAIAHYTACNPDIVIMDEMVNGLHADWIEFCLAEIAGRQAFLASQNPLLLDAVPFESAETVQQTFILCERELAQDGRRAVRRWRHMTDHDAASFMDAYEVGLQKVSEILRVKGLW